MIPRATHQEHHYAHRTGWLRAAVLGANDGIVSTGSLITGIAAATSNQEDILVAGVAGLIAGTMSMAAGEYVSVSSQSDSEHADLERERTALREDPAGELEELIETYVGRGVDRELSTRVSRALMEADALDAHAREELGFSKDVSARPLQAALASAASFAIGGALPLTSVVLVSTERAVWTVIAASLVSLACLGATSARLGGAPVGPAIRRIMFWGALAMLTTTAIGHWFQVSF